MSATQDFKISFTLANPWKFPLHGLPLRCSIPLPEGAVNDPARELVLLDEGGADCAAQWRVLSTWNDGSARFALMDYAEAELPARTTRRLTLQTRRARKPGRPGQGICVTDRPDRLTVDTGRLRWTLSKRRFSLGESIWFDDRDWVAGQGSDLCITDALGVTHRASEGPYRIMLEESGPYRVVVRMEGTHARGESRFMDYTLRLDFTAGGAQVLMRHHIRNRHGGREERRFQRCWLAGVLNVDYTACRRILHTSHGLFTMQQIIECPERVDIDVEDLNTVIRNGDSLREQEEEICRSIYEKNPDRTRLGDRRSCAPLIDLHEPGLGGGAVQVRHAPARAGVTHAPGQRAEPVRDRLLSRRRRVVSLRRGDGEDARRSAELP